MENLHKRILEEGQALSNDVLKVDSFLNHQVDADLMYEMGTYFKNYFKDHNITKIFTIESSGIAPTVMTAMQMNLPMVILKKQGSKILKGDVYQTTVHSFTKGTDYELTLQKKYISEDDNILIIDTNKNWNVLGKSRAGNSLQQQNLLNNLDAEKSRNSALNDLRNDVRR